MELLEVRFYLEGTRLIAACENISDINSSDIKIKHKKIKHPGDEPSGLVTYYDLAPEGTYIDKIKYKTSHVKIYLKRI